MTIKHLCAVALFIPSVAMADEVTRPPEELVVSEFRPIPDKEVDTSLTLLDSTVIEEASVGHFEELVQIVPNLNLSGEGSRARYFQMRGVGEREQYEGAPNPSVGFIVDDIDLSGIGGVSSTYDIRQIDILRGPQSARYGTSALAGVIYMQSAMPDDELSGNFEYTQGTEDVFAAGVAVGGPLSQSVKGRLSLFQYQDNGFRDNVYLRQNDTNERNELTARGKLLFELTDDWNLLVSGLYADFDNGYDAWTIDNDDTTESDKPGKDTQETWATSVKFTGPLGSAVDLVSITSAAKSEIDFEFDGDWGNDPFWNNLDARLLTYDYKYVNPRERTMLTQEFRFLSSPDGRLFGASTDWVFGVFAEILDEDNRISSTGVYADNFFPFSGVTDRQIDSSFDSTTLAVFGGIDSRLTDRLGLSIGLRYEYWSAEYEDSWTDVNYTGPAGGQTCNDPSIDCDPTEGLWGGHVALSYDWTQALRSYARVARGFKAGGFNPSLAALQNDSPALGPEYVQYGPEYLWNYELGLKGVWADGAVQTDLAVFYMDRDDAQLSQSSQQVPFDPNSFVFVTYNGGADVYGLELSGDWQATRNWNLYGSLGLLHSDIDDTPATQAVSPNAIGRELAHAPGYTINLGAAYRNPAGWYGRVDLNAIDWFYYDVSHNQRSEPYEVVNLRVGKTWTNWDIALWGRNIFDEEYFTRGFYFANQPPGPSDPTFTWVDNLYTKFGDPRTVGVTFKYSY